MPFSQLLRSHRHQAGLSLRSLAQRCPYAHGFLGMLETGERIPSIKVAVEIASALEADKYTFALEALTDRVIATLEKELGPIDEKMKDEIRRYLDEHFGERLSSLLSTSPKS